MKPLSHENLSYLTEELRLLTLAMQKINRSSQNNQLNEFIPVYGYDKTVKVLDQMMDQKIQLEAKILALQTFLNE